MNLPLLNLLLVPIECLFFYIKKINRIIWFDLFFTFLLSVLVLVLISIVNRDRVYWPQLHPSSFILFIHSLFFILSPEQMNKKVNFSHWVSHLKWLVDWREGKIKWKIHHRLVNQVTKEKVVIHVANQLVITTFPMWKGPLKYNWLGKSEISILHVCWLRAQGKRCK